MSIRFRILPTLVALVIAAPWTTAAESQEVEVGHLIRVTAGGLPLTGIVAEITPDAWHVSLTDGQLRSVSPSAVESLEIWETHGHAKQGLLIGAGVGLVGAVMVSSGKDCQGKGGDVATQLSESDGCSFDPVAQGALIVAGTAGAAAVGALVGNLVRTGGWRPAVAVPRGAQGMGLALRWEVPLGGYGRGAGQRR